MAKIVSLTLVVILVGAAALGCGKEPSGAPPDKGTSSNPATTGAGGSDLERLQGVWAVESIDRVSAKTRTPEALATSVRYQFHGNKLNVIVLGMWMSSTIKLDENSDPRVMVSTELDDKGEPRQRTAVDGRSTELAVNELIYKLEGDTLVLAHSIGVGGPRPTEFQARAGKFKDESSPPEVYPVEVIRLKKTNEPVKVPEPGPPNKRP